MSDETLAVLQRIEAKLDLLIVALAEDQEADAPQLTLDGAPAGAPRAEGQAL